MSEDTGQVPVTHPKSQRLLTIPEAAEWLRIAPRSVRRLISERRLRVIRINRSVRISPGEVEQFIRNGGAA